MNKEKHFTDPKTKWAEVGNDDIVISTRVRLARNLVKFPFPFKMMGEQRRQLVEEVMQAMAKTPLGQSQYVFFTEKEISPLQKELLLEKHLISPQFAQEDQGQGLLVSDDESIVVMVNEEDHVRIQSLLPGLQLTAAFAGANQVDDWLEQGLDWAFDDKIGYLTACPSNVGTGMRASVMIHLPALALTGKLEQLFQAMPKLGLTVRGIYGEGSESLGHLYQISNQITLGYSENEILARLETVVNQMIAEEKKARAWLQEQQKVKLYDLVWRAYGVAGFARTLTLGEMMDNISWMRLGIDLGILDKITKQQLNEILIAGQDHFLMAGQGKSLQQEEVDILRASAVRKILQER